ncbi:MAG: 12-oxophytodienoate reductase, partial [Betaproteobacteria bacterium]|nr:12-oxophytodienoate reductase [Betaproteobacteria bacterium]
MTRSASCLFTALSLGNLSLSSRIVMAPMTRSFSPGGIPGDEVAAYYGRRAAQDLGLIITEGTAVDRDAARNDPNVPVFHGEEALAGWKKTVDAVHAQACANWPQLWHVGALPNPTVSWRPGSPFESPSGQYKANRQHGKAMTEADVRDCIEAFAKAAADARRIGFDGVEIHGAHGYLIDQFFWDGSNHRDDAYGGATIAQRSRFAAEVIAAIRRATAPEFPICIRLSQWKQQDFNAKLAPTPEAMSQWLSPLIDAGADVLHCSQRRFWEPEFEGSDLNFAGWARKLTGKPVITVGSVGLTGEFIAAFRGEASQPASLDALIERFRQRTGTPILLNTSFNLHGHPLVNDEKDAFNVFKKT